MYAKAINTWEGGPLPLVLAALSADAGEVAALDTTGWRRFNWDIPMVEGFGSRGPHSGLSGDASRWW